MATTKRIAETRAFGRVIVGTYDYAAGKARIPNTAAAVREKLEKWVRESESLETDLPNYEMSVRGMR